MGKVKNTPSALRSARPLTVAAPVSGSAKLVAPSASAHKRAGGFVLGRKAFARISAVEGVKLSKGLEADLRRLEGVSPSARRVALVRKYGKK